MCDTMDETIFHFFLMSVGKGLKAGLLSGIVGAVVVNVFIYAYYGVTDTSYADTINVVSATLVTLIANLVGGVFFALVAKKSMKTATWLFAAGTIAIAAFMTWNTYANPAEAGFETVSATSHEIVALLAIIVLPMLFKKHANKGMSMPNADAGNDAGTAA